MSPKDSVAELLYRTGVTRKHLRPSASLLIVFAYHRIKPRERGFRTAFDRGVFGPDPGAFREQLEWLRSHTRVLSEEELLTVAETGDPLEEACSVVTFDDGYRDNYTLALPLLEELGIPATFFIPSRLIETRRLGWWDLIAYFLDRCQKRSINVNGREHLLGRKRSAVISYFHRVMRLRPADETANLLEQLSAACEVPFPRRSAQSAELMSWREVRDASSRGVRIGSHTHSHRVLKTLGRAALWEELTSSKRLLEEKTGQRIRTLAYPCGSYQDFDETVQQATVEAGYRLAFSFNTGVQQGGRLEPFDVKRLGASELPSRLAAITLFPRLFAWSS